MASSQWARSQCPPSHLDIAGKTPTRWSRVGYGDLPTSYETNAAVATMVPGWLSCKSQQLRRPNWASPPSHCPSSDNFSRTCNCSAQQQPTKKAPRRTRVRPADLRELHRLGGGPGHLHHGHHVRVAHRVDQERARWLARSRGAGRPALRHVLGRVREERHAAPAGALTLALLVRAGVGEYVCRARLLPRELGAPALHAPGRVRPLGLRARGLHVHALRVGPALRLRQQRAGCEYSAARGLLRGAAVGHLEKKADKIMIAWKVLANEELLCEGAFAASLVASGAGVGLECEAPTRGVQLVPLVREKARALLLLQLQQEQSENERGIEQFIEFPIDREVLAIDRADGRTKSAIADGRSSEWLCRLELHQQKPLKTLEVKKSEEKKSWFEIKVHRAGECRVRGNDAFKKEKYKAAIRLYKKARSAAIGALRWLECPADCANDRNEAALVNPIALACHSNLATSFWKLEKAEKCIEHATLALECDPQSVKALFRRSHALLQTKAFDDAVRDLERANQLEPENRLFRSALERARAAQTQFINKQKQAFATIF